VRMASRAGSWTTRSRSSSGGMVSSLRFMAAKDPALRPAIPPRPVDCQGLGRRTPRIADGPAVENSSIRRPGRCESGRSRAPTAAIPIMKTKGQRIANHLSVLTAAPSGDPGARADYVPADELSWFPFEAELSGLLS
jgi:hypothetical protein